MVQANLMDYYSHLRCCCCTSATCEPKLLLLYSSYLWTQAVAANQRQSTCCLTRAFLLAEAPRYAQQCSCSQVTVTCSPRVIHPTVRGGHSTCNTLLHLHQSTSVRRAHCCLQRWTPSRRICSQTKPPPGPRDRARTTTTCIPGRSPGYNLQDTASALGLLLATISIIPIFMRW